MNRGLYIVLEGAQGVGKTTQIEILSSKLQSYGYSVKVYREPDNQYHLTARAIRRLTQDPNYPLNTRAEVLLYNAARSLSLDIIKQSTESGVICLSDRNYLTTLALQYYGRGDIDDYDTITQIIDFAVGGVEPDLTLVLDCPVKVLVERVASRAQGDRFDNLDTEMLKRICNGYLAEAQSRHLPVVNAGKISDEVSEEVWGYVENLLNTKPKNTQKEIPYSFGSSPSVSSNRPHNKDNAPSTKDFIEKVNGVASITPTGIERLKSIVSNPSSNVYSFDGELDQVAVAAAMARLSRRGDDMRVTLLDEFIDKEGKDEGLIHRVVTAYGDDSVQQLVGIHMVVENASNLLTKQIEWGRLAAYLEQSTRYIYYDKKDADGNYKYYVPTNLDKYTKETYIQTMDKLFDNYSNVVHKITKYLYRTDSTPEDERDFAWKSAIRAQACDAAREMLPVATKSTVGIFASGQAIESLIMRLMAEESTEARQCGEDLLKEARKVMPAFLERADKPGRGGAMIAYRANTKKAVKEIADEVLKSTYSEEQNPVTLTDYFPKNELDTIPHMLYEHTDISENELKRAVTELGYIQKTDIFNAYVGDRLNRRHRPGRAFERSWYSWDVVCDYGIFRDLQRHRIISDLAWQTLTPRYGFEVPELVEKTGVIDEFTDSFDTSLELNSLLIKNGFEVEAQYATLFGHKMRWKVTMNAREAFHFIELRTAPQGHPGYRKLVKQMHDKLAEVHPITAEAMKFVNKDEDPELTRLAAERYTQFKLQQLE